MLPKEELKADERDALYGGYVDAASSAIGGADEAANFRMISDLSRIVKDIRVEVRDLGSHVPQNNLRVLGIAAALLTVLGDERAITCALDDEAAGVGR